MANEIQDNNYFQISGWMLNRLQLKGNDLIIYAIIFGFSQDGYSEFNGSLQYICNFSGASRPTVIKSIKNLVGKNLIIKSENKISGVTFNRYKANLQVVKNLYNGGKETLQVSGKETLLNNKSLDNNTIIIEKENCIKEKSRFSPPSVEEVRSYCEERKNDVDAERFVDYYTSNGWKVGKNAMKDWRAAVRTWERSAYKSTAPDPTDGGRFAIRKPADDEYPF